MERPVKEKETVGHEGGGECGTVYQALRDHTPSPGV